MVAGADVADVVAAAAAVWRRPRPRRTATGLKRNYCCSWQQWPWQWGDAAVPITVIDDKVVLAVQREMESMAGSWYALREAAAGRGVVGVAVGEVRRELVE